MRELGSEPPGPPNRGDSGGVRERSGECQPAFATAARVYPALRGGGWTGLWRRRGRLGARLRETEEGVPANPPTRNFAPQTEAMHVSPDPPSAGSC